MPTSARKKTGADAETLYVKVYLNKPIPEQANKFEAKQRRVAVEVAEFSDNDGEIQGSGNLLGKTDWINGTFDTTTKTFTPGGAAALIGRGKIGKAKQGRDKEIEDGNLRSDIGILDV